MGRLHTIALGTTAIAPGPEQPPSHAFEQTQATHPLLAPLPPGSPAPGDKPVLVLVHGFGTGAPLWFHCFDTLAGSGTFSRVFALDWLGVGQSHRPKYPRLDPVRGEVSPVPQSAAHSTPTPHPTPNTPALTP